MSEEEAKKLGAEIGQAVRHLAGLLEASEEEAELVRCLAEAIIENRGRGRRSVSDMAERMESVHLCLQVRMGLFWQSLLGQLQAGDLPEQLANATNDRALGTLMIAPTYVLGTHELGNDATNDEAFCRVIYDPEFLQAMRTAMRDYMMRAGG